MARKNIACHLPDNPTETRLHAGIKLSKPPLSTSIDPRMLIPPQIKDFENDILFQDEFQKFVKDLAIACNWHNHTHSCWKYLDDNDPRDDDHCRFRVNGQTRSLTELDPETSSILLRRLHPWINNYNDLILFLVQCNMDIKYIGSGEAAKALVYYVTDYITKQTLPTHVGFSALQYAIVKNNEKFDGDVQTGDNAKARSMVTKVVNQLAARQEMPHQQIMSYLVGGGDYYTSHKFKNLRWTDFVDHVLHNTRTLHDDEIIPEHARDNKNPSTAQDQHCVLSINHGSITVHNHVLDYALRGDDEMFSGLSLWDFVANTEKISHASETEHLSFHVQHQNSMPGRQANARGRFDRVHPQHNTHLLRLKDYAVTPVLIGPAIHRPDRGDDEYELYCRLMLILFKPWKSISDLIESHTSFKSAFQSYSFLPAHKKIMKNFATEMQCKDARQASEEERQSQNSTFIPQFGDMDIPNIENASTLENALLNDQTLFEYYDNAHELDLDDDLEELSADNDRLSQTLYSAKQYGLFNITSTIEETNGTYTNVVHNIQHPNQIPCAEEQSDLMEKLKRNKRPIHTDDHDGSRRTRRRLNDSSYFAVNGENEMANTCLMNLHDHQSNTDTDQVMHDIQHDRQAINQIEQERGFIHNPEQRLAFRVVGEHLINDNPHQLLLYISGVGGTGKSYVINKA